MEMSEHFLDKKKRKKEKKSRANHKGIITEEIKKCAQMCRCEREQQTHYVAPAGYINTNCTVRRIQ